jgi:hypothetical protein
MVRVRLLVVVVGIPRRPGAVVTAEVLLLLLQ